jgi:hypothetical protein
MRPRPLPLATVAIGAALAWFVVGWVGGPADGGTWAVQHPRYPSIEPPEVMVAIVADRPLAAARHDRPGSLRPVLGLSEAGRFPPTLPLLLTGDVSFPTSPFATGPLSFGLARRGPPTSIGR